MSTETSPKYAVDDEGQDVEGNNIPVRSRSPISGDGAGVEESNDKTKTQ